MVWRKIAAGALCVAGLGLAVGLVVSAPAAEQQGQPAQAQPLEPRPPGDVRPGNLEPPLKKEESQARSFTGKVVDLYAFLMKEEHRAEPMKKEPAKPGASQKPGAGEERSMQGQARQQPGQQDQPVAAKPPGHEGPTYGRTESMGPIVLIPDEKSALQKIIPGKRIFLLVCAPGHDDLYQTAKGMLGERVELTGRTLERDGIHAVCMEKITRTEVARAE